MPLRNTFSAASARAFLSAIAQTPASFQLLVVAGGGAGAYGGAGAGGLTSSITSLAIGSTYTVTVGAGAPSFT